LITPRATAQIDYREPYAERTKALRRREQLIERRKTVGLSQEKLAEAVGVDRTTVMRWETGEFAPQPGQRPLLAKALQVSVEDLRRLLGTGSLALYSAAAVQERTASRQLPEPALTWASGGDLSLCGDRFALLFGQLVALVDDAPGAHPPRSRERAYAQLVQNLAAWAHTVNRRELLRMLGWAATAAAGSPALHNLDEQECERVVLAIQMPSRVDAHVIEHIEAVLMRCLKQDDLLGPQAALDTVLAQRSLVRSLLPEAPSSVRDRLLSVYASLSRLAGWLSFDLNSYDAAADYYESARQAAHEAHDTELAAFVLCYLSYLATWRDQARLGIDHAVAAQGWANQTDDHRLQAFALDMAARALARDGQSTTAFGAIDQARQTLTQADAERTSYAYFLAIGGRLTSTESLCQLYLGDFDRAAVAAQEDLAMIDNSLARDRALTTLRLGICRLRATKPDVPGAARAIGEAGALAVHNRSARLIDRLRRAAAELEPWQHVPEARAVRHELAAHGLG
jgi:transcriptional regulator with XRE-family HTH domain